MLFSRIPAVLGVAGLLALPATAARAVTPDRVPSADQSVVTAQSAGADRAAIAARAGNTASGQDSDFLKAAHQVNLAEIATGRIAWGKTADPRVKKLAGTLMVDHIRMDSDLYQVARRLRVVLPDAPDSEQQALANRYQAAGADTFDEYYISTQLAGHRAALKMVTEQAEQGDDPAVKRLAAKAAPIITRHQVMLRDAAAAEGIAGYAGAGGRQG